jgi:OmpA-OmpF porin, OOP family
MSGTLIDSVKSVFTDPVLKKFSVLLGETEANSRKAVHAAIPMILTEILHKSYATEATSSIRDLSKKATANDFFGGMHELTSDAGGLLPGSILLNKGTDYSKSLLTTRTDAVVHEISMYAGISIPSATFITGIVSFACLDHIGRHIAHSNADAAALSIWLQSQTDSIRAAIPAGLEVKHALAIPHYPWERSVKRSRNMALYAVLSLLIVGLVIFFIYRYSQKAPETATVAVTDSTTTAASPTPPAPDTANSTVKVTLPNGQVLDAYKGGTEDRLIAFLSDPAAKLDKKNGNWFDFTGIDFASNSASLLLKSEAQLKNIEAILAAFPKAKIKIGGYSDNTGDSTDNVRLSQQRADNIEVKLKEFGTKSHQLVGAKGYGPRYPVGDNGTAAGRAVNRRMSIDVKAK